MELLIDGMEPWERKESSDVNGDGDAGFRIPDDALISTMHRAAEIALRTEGIDPEGIEISLSFVGPEEIRGLNREYRDVDRVTDVLSFPLVEDLNELPGLKEEESGPEDDDASEDDAWAAPLGDVVICLERAEAQAEEYGHSREREIVYLFVHSMLHLLGYDHMEVEEQRQMRTREEEIMRAVDLTREGD